MFSEARPALEKAAAARSRAAPARAAAVDALAALAFVAGEEPDEVDDVLALLAALWQDGAPATQAYQEIEVFESSGLLHLHTCIAPEAPWRGVPAPLAAHSHGKDLMCSPR